MSETIDRHLRKIILFYQNGAGKKKGKGGRKLSKNKNKNSQRKTTKKPNMPVGGNDLTAKIFSTMEKHKEVGFHVSAFR